MENILAPFLEQQGFVLLDGALATELEYRGADLNDPLWSAKILLEAPELIRAVHEDYLAAGADILITASYQATFAGLAQRGFGREAATAIMRRSVALAREARDRFWAEPANREGRLRPLVAASVGPYGAFLADGSEYRGQYGLSVAELMDWHRPRLEVLLDSGADLLACETIPCPEEAEALVRLLSERPAARAWLSFSCCDERHVCQGDLFAEAVTIAEDCTQVLATGVNCTPPHFVASLLAEGSRRTSKPLVAYPNSGEGWDAEHHCWLPGQEGKAFAAYAEEWYRAGARLIGGCCRTRPADIRELRAALRDMWSHHEEEL
jgi:homocysteine S-methyltransferase